MDRVDRGQRSGVPDAHGPGEERGGGRDVVLCCCSGESHQDGTRTGPSTPPSSGGVSLGQPVAARAGQWCAIRLRSRRRLLGVGLGVPVNWGGAAAIGTGLRRFSAREETALGILVEGPGRTAAPPPVRRWLWSSRGHPGADRPGAAAPSRQGCVGRRAGKGLVSHRAAGFGRATT